MMIPLIPGEGLTRFLWSQMKLQSDKFHIIMTYQCMSNIEVQDFKLDKEIERLSANFNSLKEKQNSQKGGMPSFLSLRRCPTNKH